MRTDQLHYPNPWNWSSMPCDKWSWPTHMQKFKVNGQLFQKTAWKRMDRQIYEATALPDSLMWSVINSSWALTWKRLCVQMKAFHFVIPLIHLNTSKIFNFCKANLQIYAPVILLHEISHFLWIMFLLNLYNKAAKDNDAWRFSLCHAQRCQIKHGPCSLEQCSSYSVFILNCTT